MSLPPPSPATTVTFFAALQHLPDPRDNRGKRHDLAFVLCGVILAIMAGRSRVSAIHRFLRNRLAWLREMTQAQVERCISRAQLPRLLARVEWEALNALIFTHFGVHLESPAAGEWIAVDGKALRGSPGEQVVLPAPIRVAASWRTSGSRAQVQRSDDRAGPAGPAAAGGAQGHA